MHFNFFNARNLSICFISLLVLTSGCRGKDDTAPASDLKAKKIFPVEVTMAVSEIISHTLEAVGSFMPEEEVTVGAEVAGTIKSLAVDEGEAIKKGRLLLQIDDENMRLKVEETKAMLREAKARLTNARTALKRMTELFQDGIVGQNDFDDAQTQASLNQAVVEKLQAALNQSKKSMHDTRVVSPIDGVIGERMVSMGEYVKIGADLFKVVDSNPLKLVFSLPEKDVGDIKKDQLVTIITRAFPGKTFEGRIYFVNPKVNQDTRTIEVKAWVDNSDYKLKPGFFVNVTVFLQEKKSLTLPESAVLVREGSIIVMVVTDGRITYKKVLVGFRFDGKVEILDGITAEDKIVTYGRSEITEGTYVKIISSP